jgi:hypothetical protein
MTRNVFACHNLMLQAQSKINCSEECSNVSTELTHSKHSMTSYQMSIPNDTEDNTGQPDALVLLL